MNSDKGTVEALQFLCPSRVMSLF